ncbi:MAG: TerB family tellurite resistance protein [Deltaproteobacteria bacterium]|nr:TerB family tellurite resistance protein [Deltaproteobacteria bacterium]
MSQDINAFQEDMPNITGYSWQRRRNYLMLVAAIAAADNRLHKKERELLEVWVKEFRLPQKSRDAVFSVAKGKPLPNREKIERSMAVTDLAYSLMLDLMGMAMVDGVLMDKEINLLRRIADNLGIDRIEFNILIEFVHASYQSAWLDNPEPLFEHNIESAFDLLREKKAKLFRHTLFCVASESCDFNLKKRWHDSLS